MSGAGTTSLLYEARSLAFAYRLGALRVPALRGVDLTLERGGFYCLAGPSGSGKDGLRFNIPAFNPLQGQGRGL